jgi:Transglycosylase SLT domain
MAHARAVRAAARRSRRRSRRRVSRAQLIRVARRALIALAAMPFVVRVVVGVVLVVAVWSAVNWVYQVVRKPTELFFPVSGVLDKAPSETWRQYGPLFRRHATVVITPELLAALAQVEGSGNPVARTYWRWRLSWNPFEVYEPASSAVGMYQITDPTFREARRFCIHDHVVVEAGAWHDVHACWFNGLYSRVIPSHAIEMTAALLDRSVADTLARQRVGIATLAQKQDLAAVIHLCGSGPGDAYARRGFRLTPHQHCGDHDTAHYVAVVNAKKRQFARLGALEL